MKFNKQLSNGGLFLPSAALKISGFEDSGQVEIHALKNTAVITAVLIAVVSHRSQIRKGTIRPEHIHKLLKFVFEFPRVELVAVVGPPSVVELFSGSSEVHPYMAYRSQHRILGLVHLGIEKARLLNGSGPKRKGIFYCRLCLPHHLVHLHYFMNTINTTTTAKSLSEKLRSSEN